MTKADIFSGFLGAGKTTLIKKLIAEAYQGEKLVLIENEFGDIAIDGGFMQEAGIQVNELNSGCICCSLVGDFHDALLQVIEQYQPDRILIEPSGVGKLSDIILAVRSVEGVEVNSASTVCDAAKCKIYLKNFGEFYVDQVQHAGAIVLSRTGNISEEKLNQCLTLLRQHNPDAVIITTPWEQIDGKAIQDAIERTDTLEKALQALAELPLEEDEFEHEHEHHGEHEHEHHHEHEHEHEHHGNHDHEHEHEHEHHGEHDGDHGHDHDHDHEYEHHGENDHEHEHEHEDHDEHEHDHNHEHDGGHDHEHEHEHGHHAHEHGHHHHHHHHHHDGEDHDADEIFDSWGVETPRKFTSEELYGMLKALDQEEQYGAVLRCKGIVDSQDGAWLHFDYVPGEAEVRTGTAGVTGRLCVIGSDLKMDALKALFQV